MRLLKNIWSGMPESRIKKSLRVAAHNIKQRNSARFQFNNAVYKAHILDFDLYSIEPSFDILRIIHQFEAQHKVAPGQVVIDAGAFQGLLTNVFAHQVGRSGRVVAFEPDALSRARILQNLKLNGEPAHVDVIPKGLWNCDTEIEFCERGALGSSAFWDGPGGRKVKIHTTTLDSVVLDRGLTRVDFVKMNIEGSEIKALEGAVETIRQFEPDFAISSDHFIDGDVVGGERTCTTVEKMLSGQGYRTETVKYGAEWITYGTSAS